MRPLLLGLVIAAALTAALPALAASNSELKVGSDGTFTAKNLVVMQKAGSALYCRAVWGESFVRLAVLTSAAGTTTEFIKAHGGTASVGDVVQGDIIDVVGTLQTGADTLLVNATKVNDHSLNVEGKSALGTIKSVGDGSFTMTDKKLGTITVSVGTSTVEKGVRTISNAELVKGDKVLSLSGAYDFSTNTLTASGSIVIYQDPSVFKPRMFVGTLKEAPGTALPAIFLVSGNGTDYKVYLSADAKVLSASGKATELSRFTVGDKVRLYGSVRQDNLANLDATIIRDLNF